MYIQSNAVLHADVCYVCVCVPDMSVYTCKDLHVHKSIVMHMSMCSRIHVCICMLHMCVVHI